MSEEITKVSELYRKYQDRARVVLGNMHDAKAKMREENISHSMYLDLERELRILELERNKCLYIAMGINLAREELF